MICRYEPDVIRDLDPGSVNLIPAPPAPRVPGMEAGEKVVAFQGPVTQK